MNQAEAVYSVQYPVLSRCSKFTTDLLPTIDCSVCLSVCLSVSAPSAYSDRAPITPAHEVAYSVVIPVIVVEAEVIRAEEIGAVRSLRSQPIVQE